MIEVKLNEDDRLDWALKTFSARWKVGLVQDLCRKRYYVKPSQARRLKAAAARRARSGRRRARSQGRPAPGRSAPSVGPCPAPAQPRWVAREPEIYTRGSQVPVAPEALEGWPGSG